jgi:hypothetical protein
VITRVPIARGHDERDALHQLVERTDDRVPIGYRESASGAEVVLDVNDDKALHLAPNIVRRCS